MKALIREREFLIILVILVIIILGAKVVRYHNARTIGPIPAQPTACQTNLYIIDHAITHWAKYYNKSTTNYPSAQDIQPFLPDGKLPSCPDGGTYHLGTLAFATTCDVHGYARDVEIYPQKSTIIKLWRMLSMGNFVSSGPSIRSGCIANMKQLDGAAQQWALENKKKDDELVNPFAAAQYLKGGQFPVCPLGGKYSYTQISNAPCCTIPGHTLP